MVAQVALPRIINVGSGARATVGDVLARLGLHRPLLVTDGYLVASGAAEDIRKTLQSRGITALVFSDTVPDPTTASLESGLHAIRSHRADSVIGFGGGSPMDTAKALAFLSAHGGEMRDYKAPRDNVSPGLPVLAIPTTAGSGSEATQFTVITDSATNEKMLCTGVAFLPVAAIVDDELTTSMPARLTADTGVDALTHAIEAYVSRKSNPFSDSLALAAISTISTHLRRAYRDGEDERARRSMMLASTQAGIAFSNSSVALVHGMSRPLGVHFHVAHGLSNAMLLTTVTAYSVGSAPDRYAACARALGAATAADSDTKAGRLLVDSLRELCAALHVPTPQTYGIDRVTWENLSPLMARQALASGSPQNNPRVPSECDIVELYRVAYSGG